MGGGTHSSASRPPPLKEQARSNGSSESVEGAESQSSTVPSSLAVARVRPSGANATANRAGVAGQRVAEALRLGPGRRDPTGAPSAPTGGGQGAPVRGERHRGHGAGGGRSAGRPAGGPGRSVGEIPQQHRPSRRWRWPGCARPGRTPPRHRVGVAGQRVAQPARPGRVGEIPQQHRLVRRWRWPGAPVRGERHRLHVSVWPVSGSPSRRGRAGSVRSHSSTVRSSLAVARVRPSGANATGTHSRCGRSAGRPAGAAGGVGTSHNSTDLS